MDRPLFFVGANHTTAAAHLERSMLSVNILLTRKSDFRVSDWIMDSGAFTRISSGREHLPLEEYAGMIDRWARCGNLLAAVAQDYMCEQFILDVTGLTVDDHQRMTIERYDALRPLVSATHLMPVLQGYEPEDYVRHIGQYGDRLEPGSWVGIGSVCKRNSSVGEVEAVMDAVVGERPDLRYHGFGLKLTALTSFVVSDGLYSCDSMAWSYAARREGRNAQDVNEAIRYAKRVNSLPVQTRML